MNRHVAPVGACPRRFREPTHREPAVGPRWVSTPQRSQDRKGRTTIELAGGSDDMGPASMRLVASEGQPPFDSLLRWIREELDATLPSKRPTSTPLELRSSTRSITATVCSS